MPTRYWTIIDSNNEGLKSVSTDLSIDPINHDSETWILTDGKGHQGDTYDRSTGTWVEPLDSRTYDEKRKAEYPSQDDQLDMQYWDAINGTSTWVDAITAIKVKYLKK